MNPIDETALFRLGVLGPLTSRGELPRGELARSIRQIAQQEYAIPGSQRRHISEKTLRVWYDLWRREGIQGLASKPRTDRGASKLDEAIQDAILAAKRENPRRSIRQIILLLEGAGVVPRDALSKSAVHRLLKTHNLSRISGPSVVPGERRSFVAEHAGSIWYGDVMHGPTLSLGGKRRKAYLVTLFDDASRLVTHSAFCLSETALDIEGVLKQALMRRGLPNRLVVDNGSAYRSATLQGICARLSIRLVYCRPYDAPAKGKIERWHRTLRSQFLAELDTTHIRDLGDLNARLWAWIDQIYNRSKHSALGEHTPLSRYQQDLPRIRLLGPLATQLDELFWHRVKRLVRRDGTVSYEGSRFEVPYELTGQHVQLVVDPHTGTVMHVENDEGKCIGMATPLDAIANSTRRRQRPAAEPATAPATNGPNLIELAHRQHYPHTEE